MAIYRADGSRQRAEFLAPEGRQRAGRGKPAQRAQPLLANKTYRSPGGAAEGLDSTRSSRFCHPLTSFGVRLIYLANPGFRRVSGCTLGYQLPPYGLNVPLADASQLLAKSQVIKRNVYQSIYFSRLKRPVLREAITST